jgi:hypothetical protein
LDNAKELKGCEVDSADVVNHPNSRYQKWCVMYGLMILKERPIWVIKQVFLQASLTVSHDYFVKGYVAEVIKN